MYYQFNVIIITQLLYMVAYLYHMTCGAYIHFFVTIVPRIMIYYDNTEKPPWLLVKTKYILLLPCSGIMHMYVHLCICMYMYACIYVCTYASMYVHMYLCMCIICAHIANSMRYISYYYKSVNYTV